MHNTLDAGLARLGAKVDALPTTEWMRCTILREIVRTTALAAEVAVAGALALCIA